jgi:hypothetical protein
MNKKTVLLGLVAVGVGLIVGFLVGRQMPDKESVRVALYKACVNSVHYKPKSDEGCNRRSINLMMALIYDGTYLPPPPDTEAIAEYESELNKYKQK